MATLTADAYRRPLFDPEDQLFRNCLLGSSALGALILVAILLTPIRVRMMTRVEELPTRFARLILEPQPQKASFPKAAPAADRVAPGHPGGGGGGGGPAAKASTPAPAAVIPTAGGRHDLPPLSRPGAGQAGRERAQSEVRSALASSAGSLASTLQGLSTSLQAPALEAPSHAGGGRGHARVVRSARSDDQLGAVSTGIAGGTGSADLGNSVVVGSLVAIGDLARGPGGGSGGGLGGGSGRGIGSGTGDGLGSGSGGGEGGGSGGGIGSGIGSGSGGGSGPGAYRSNASLLAVIQRYAPGIQYCYGNELKRDPTLRGKLVVAVTVAASGDVIEATVVQNTVGSQRLAACALSQIRDWKFPAISGGVTTFQAPFVFTPPN